MRGALRLSAPRIDAGRVYWIEGRPSEGGRQVLMVGRLPAPDARGPARLVEVAEAVPSELDVRTRVHEYGGGEYAVRGDRLCLVDDRSGRVLAGRVGGPFVPLTPAAERDAAGSASRYADLRLSPDGRWLVAVEERPRSGDESENRLVAFGLREADGGAGVAPVGAPRVVASGHDFYASAVFSPAGDRLAWLAWDHPHMPWNESVLELCAWSPEGPAGPVHGLCGEPGESLFQPRFAPDGALYVVSDRSGAWNLMRVPGLGGAASAPLSEPVPVHRDPWEIGRAQWVFGQSTWAFVETPGGTREVLASASEEGLDTLRRIDLETGASRTEPSAFRTIGGVEVEEGWAVCLAGCADASMALQLWRVDGGRPSPVRESAAFAIPEDAISPAEPRRFPTTDGETTHAFVYAPRSGAQRPPPGERPPLLVKSHGGPTSSASAVLDPRIQFWTSRGFAVADVDYRGSTGHGRAYRDALHERWGVVDVDDCVAVARALADEGLVDGERLAISGGSAGGFTTLCALTFRDCFAAGASHYGIGDLEALARDTHKFESRYTDWLVGPLPETRARYRERSPIHHPERLARPVIFFQGLEDRVVPPSQAESMVAVLAERGLPHAYVPFEGEQHGFRRAENIRTALDGELYFYARLFGFEAPRPAGVRVVDAAAG